MLSAAAFQTQFLKRQLWSKQLQILHAVATRDNVAIKGCHGSGKTFVVSGLVPYELLGHKENLVLTIAPTLRQVKSFWAEVHTALGSLPERIRRGLPEMNQTGWELSPKCKAIGFSSNRGVNAQSFHGKEVLIIVDEAPGIAPDVWDAIEGIRAAGHVRIVKLCNPTVPSGPVYDDFTRLRGSTECITISAFDTPNLAGLTLETLLGLPESELDYAPVPWLTRRRWVKEMYYKWGPANPRFLSRVLGEFPSQSDDSVFELAWIERAGLPYEPEKLEPYLKAKTFIQIGIDVAGAGADETAATARMAGFVLAQDAWAKADPFDECLAFLRNIRGRFPAHRLIVIGDTVGIGYYFMRGIARQAQFLGIEVYGFVANEAPTDPVLYINKKAEAYFQTREYLKAGLVHGIEDELTKAQLSDCRYRERLGRIEIESKAEQKARGGDSPDRAESLIMAFWKFSLRNTTLDLQDEVAVHISPY